MASRDPPTPWLCAVRGLIRSDSSAHLDSVKAAPLLSDVDMDSSPPPSPFSLHRRTPSTREMLGKRTRRGWRVKERQNHKIIYAELGLRKRIDIQSTAHREIHGGPVYCGVECSFRACVSD